MTDGAPPKRTIYDLEQRANRFAKDVRDLVKCIPVNVWNTEYTKQLIRSSGSVGANYIEANEAIGTKDFLKQIRIALRESKESCHWLDLLDIPASTRREEERRRLMRESRELLFIFHAITKKARATALEKAANTV